MAKKIIDPKNHKPNLTAPVVTKDVKKVLSDTRVWTIGNLPFFGTLLAHLPFVERKDLPTFATDGKYIYYNVKFAQTLTPAEIRFVVLHEILHCALSHLWRRNHREPMRWNISIDIVVNGILMEMIERQGSYRDRNVLKMPDCGVLDPELFKIGSSERIYEDIKVTNVEMPQGGFGFDQHMDGNGETDADRVAESERWKVITAQAAQVAKTTNRGDLAGTLETLIGELLHPKVRWDRYLASVAAETLRDDYDWFEPDEAHFSDGLYLPDLAGQGTHVAFLVDTSGSISDEDLTAATSEGAGILRARGVIDVLVLGHDVDVHYDKLHRPNQPMPTKWGGRGGTSHKPVFERLAREKNINLCVCFTDLYTDFPEVPPKCRVVWVVVNNNDATVPFGEVISYERS